MTPTMVDSVVLRRLTTRDLPAIVGWFQDPDTSRFLGGPDWPAAMLANAERAVGTDFRGARQTAADHFLAIADGVPVGYVDCGTFDRCAVYGGDGQDGPIILETIEAITGAIAFTIDPARRREGLATQMIRDADRPPGPQHGRVVRGRCRAREPRVPAHARGRRISPAIT